MVMKTLFRLAVTKVLLLSTGLAFGQGQVQPPAATLSAVAAQAAAPLYRDLLNPTLNPEEVYRVRNVSLQREDLHVVFDDGTLGLIRAVDGHVTGAVFEGVGEILLVPPNRAERNSLALFTGSAVLEQRFESAYLRFFDDDLVKQLRAGFRGRDDDPDFVGRWEQPVKVLAPIDSLQILEAITNASEPTLPYVHLRLGGTQLGIFDVYFDPRALEQITVAQERLNGNIAFYDTWTSFPMRSARDSTQPRPVAYPPFSLSDYRMHLTVEPPTELKAESEVTITPHSAGQRTVVLELSRYLRVSEARANGQPVEVVQREAVSGTELARRSDDLVGLVFPAALEKDHSVRLSFKYSGPVMFSAGTELLYVGERGTWYPNIGPAYSAYDLTFDYPDDWLLVATGKQVEHTVAHGRRITRFVSQKPIARAGFNLGKFETGSATTGGVSIHAYAARNVEQALAVPEERAGKHPHPAKEVQQIADQAANTVRVLSAELDAFPYSNLEITQLPALLSQSWPGLIYLSSMAFLEPDERRAIGLRDPYNELLLSRLMLAHETAHQWWGDAVDWVSYRDEWIIEALANYSALLILEKQDPQAMKTALEFYKVELLKETSSGIVAQAGPVTLGWRLTSSRFPQAYERVLYGRGTWLIHMLRTTLRQASGNHSDALFFAALKGLLDRSPNHKISTHDLEEAFEKVLPSSFTYEGRKSLDWFFDSWVNDVSIPSFSLEDVKLVPDGPRIKVTGTIRETNAAKDLVTAVPIYIVDENGKSRFANFVFADEPDTAFTLTVRSGVKQILLDPEGTLLRR
ncbi:MAG TPA: M1 family aminopeptidase [Terriglobales bacterium]